MHRASRPRLQRPARSNPSRLAATVLLLAALALPGCGGVPPPHPGTGAASGLAAAGSAPATARVKPEVLLGQFAERIKQIPEFQKTFGPRSGEEAAALGLGLAAKGTPRLPTDRLVRRVELMHRYFIYEKDDAVCAAVGRNENAVVRKGQETLAVNAVLEVLGESAPDYTELLVKAAEAELEGQPVPPPPAQGEINTALERLFARVPKGEVDRLKSVLSSLDKVGTADACWAVRGYYQALVGLQEPSRGVMARAIVRPLAGQ